MEKRQGLFESFSQISEESRREVFVDLNKKLKDAAKDYPTLRRLVSTDVSQDGIFEMELLTSNGKYSISKIVDRKRMQLVIIRMGRIDKPQIFKETVFLRARINSHLDEPFFEYHRELVNGSKRILRNNAPSIVRIEKFVQEMKAVL